jgi:hypothetical protein
MYFKAPKEALAPVAHVEAIKAIGDEALWLRLSALEAIHRWPRSWWRAMYARAGLLGLRRKKDPCVQVNLSANSCQRKHGHAGPCRFGVWSGGIGWQQEIDPGCPTPGAGPGSEE